MERKKLAEFTVRILSADNSTWQGEVESGGETFAFQSEMQLLKWLCERNMKKKTTRLLSFVLALAMVFGLLPATELHAHATAYTWDPDATMTLKCGDTVVEPKEVIETADTKLKVYQIESILDYTLTTSADNDYAVMFEVNWSVISEDENGYKDYDYEMTVTLDNVTIRTYNPRVDQNEKFTRR